MKQLGHEMIFASAGSGKTHALTTRFIRLLALGVPPERIAALTFTRKAAGEFFGEILNRLAGAAGAEVEAKQLACEVEQAALTTADFRRLLRGMVGAMHRLNLGTLDGFFARIVRSFPMELGLAAEPEILDDRAVAEETRQVFSRLFAAGHELTAEQRELIEAFKRATFGAEEKAVAETLDRFIEGYLGLYRAVPQPDRWGATRRIWPKGFPWGDGRKDAAAAAATLRCWAGDPATGLKEAPRERWLKFADQAVAWTPGGPRPKELEYLLEVALAGWTEVQAGRVELTVLRQKCRPGPAECVALALLVRRVFALELGRRLAATQGIAAVVRAFDEAYDVAVRRAGRLTFADLQQLLVPGGGAAPLAMEPGAEARLAVDYRLDARVDHWLFDEFQDTSFQQWKILESLIDEVVQDPSGRRSLFYVGDVKQAIFTWREGDPRLFEHVAARYRSAAGGGVVPRELNDSYRSGPAVIEMVNRVCGDAAAMEKLFPEAAGEWNRHWREHRSARPKRHGQAALLLADDEPGRWAATLQVLQAIEPTKRGLTCAVLVRANSTGAALADYLRREGGLPAVAESDLHVGGDNPATTTLAALLQLAAHPGDEFARQVVAMSPLAGLLAADGPGATTRVLRQVQTQGFEAWIGIWARRIDPVLAVDDDFSRGRLRQMATAGRIFDETGNRDIDAFLRFLAEFVVREPEGAGVVRVMTVHKSKGLGFDVVILPDLQGQKLAQRREGPAVHKGGDRGVEWILQYPGALIAENDPVLRQYLADAVAENCYEQLSLLYVALTRAKRAVYAIVEPLGRSASTNFPRLLTETLGDREISVPVGKSVLPGVWSAGAPNWAEASALGAGQGNAPGIADCAPIAAGDRPRLAARTPSEMNSGRGSAIFARGVPAGAEFGSRVHRLLAQIEWRDGAEAAIKAALQGEHDAPAVAEVRACLAAGDLAPVFARPPGRAGVWRERAFEAAIDGSWYSGVFDRVVVEHGPGGPVAAWVYDFKTDRGASNEELCNRHGGQLGLYRRVVARLTGLPESQVRAMLVATARAQLVPLEFDNALYSLPRGGTNPGES